MKIEIMEEKKQSFKESFFELARFAVIALVVVIPIRVLVAEPFIVSGSSMFPTFKNNDYLIIDKLSYKLKDPKRDDIVVFKYPNDPKKFFIKRIIGLPNETLDIKGSEVFIFNEEHPKGFKLDEPYVKNISSDNIHHELKNNEYFVMGDNRSGSYDSRYWGTLEKDFFTGRVLLRLLPINNIDILPGQYEQL